MSRQGTKRNRPLPCTNVISQSSQTGCPTSAIHWCRGFYKDVNHQNFLVQAWKPAHDGNWLVNWVISRPPGGWEAAVWVRLMSTTRVEVCACSHFYDGVVMRRLYCHSRQRLSSLYAPECLQRSCNTNNASVTLSNVAWWSTACQVTESPSCEPKRTDTLNPEVFLISVTLRLMIWPLYTNCSTSSE